MAQQINLQTVKQLLDVAESNIRQAKSLLLSSQLLDDVEGLNCDAEKQIVEGVFDGEQMIGQMGKRYPVPANYASKSKLVAGDTLKLTIASDGTFLYKQIGPISRKKLVGELEDLGDGKFCVKCGGVNYRVLAASVSYFKAKDGDKLTILIPEDKPTEWAAVENMI